MTDTYCWPSTIKVTGAITICPPRLAFHSNSPVHASSAWKWPSRPPVNSRSDAVVNMPPSLTSNCRNFQAAPPERGDVNRDEIPSDYNVRSKSEDAAAVDFISGMTDHYAIRTAEAIRPGIAAPFTEQRFAL